MSELERLARAVARGLGYDYDDLYASKREYYDDRGARHDVNTPRKPDMIEAARAILRELRPPNINRKLLLKANAVDIVRYDGDSETVFHATGNEIEEIFEVVIDHILSEGNT